jgi:dGTP triphosphohydrolase
MPPRYAVRVGEQDVHRVVADYVAGMTDRYCLRCYRRVLAGCSGGSVGSSD